MFSGRGQPLWVQAIGASSITNSAPTNP